MKAFTLVELLVSISIIGMMAALSISAYPKFSEQISLSTDTYKMVAFFRETQIYGSSAIAPPGTKIVYAFEIDQVAGTIKRYQILSPTDNTSTYYLSNISHRKIWRPTMGERLPKESRSFRKNDN